MVCWITQCSRALSAGACLGSLRANTLQTSLHQTFSRAVQSYWCLSRTFSPEESRSISLVGLRTLTPHKKDAHALLIWNVSLIIFWYTPFAAHYLPVNTALIMGLAVTGSSYIVEIKMPESNPGELQRDFMFKWKTVEFSKGTWILIHKDFIPWAVLSWPGAPKNPGTWADKWWLCCPLFLRERSTSSSPTYFEK